MHGVPTDLDLSAFHGALLEQIALGLHIVHFRFGAERRPEISIEGHWELRGPDGALLDQQTEPQVREAYRVHVLLGCTVIASAVDAPRSFALTFDSGHVLRVFDDSAEYESFSVQPGNVYV